MTVGLEVYRAKIGCFRQFIIRKNIPNQNCVTNRKIYSILIIGLVLCTLGTYNFIESNKREVSLTFYECDLCDIIITSNKCNVM